LHFKDAGFERDGRFRKRIKGRQEVQDFEGGGDIRTVLIPRMYEETCISIKADVALRL
jgi:hypothetical protein